MAIHIGTAGYPIWTDDSETELLGIVCPAENAEFRAVNLQGVTVGTGFDIGSAGQLLSAEG